MRLLACMRMDLSEGFRESYKRMILVMLVALCIIVVSIVRIASFGLDIPALSWGDGLVACFGGIRVFDPARDRFLPFPTTWLFMLGSILYVTFSYPYRDLMGFGRGVLIASGGRRTWWVSKCIWTAVSTLVCFLLVGIVCLLSALVLRGRLSLGIDQDVFEHLLLVPMDADPPVGIVGFVLSVPCLLVALSLMQMALALMIGPVLSFGATMALLLASAYAFNPLLPGNYLMAARTHGTVLEGMSPFCGMALAACIALISIVVGGMYFSRMDCINKEYAI
ncbi:hypothetical protein J2S71_002273 [Olsenella profusa DSM 13989]|uniref:hypothetical protein n=1 Tax=Olsenella profusa TaxID=138595 RepID=UPI002780BBDC|nr:hypothetical protein [Olsenella profusa]MDP9860577.1 hypothetical protein [Olsenella profusa DSM 13989]